MGATRSTRHEALRSGPHLSAMTRRRAQKSAKQKFADALAGHLTNGTRPGNAIGEPWTYEAFASEIITSQQISDFRAVSPRSVSNWCNGRSLPREISPLLVALFGSGPSTHRDQLNRLFRNAKKEQRSSLNPILNAEPDPAGGRWRADGDHFSIVRSPTTGDARASIDRENLELQRLIVELADNLHSYSFRLRNLPHWSGISDSAKNLSDLLSCEPDHLVDRLPSIYVAVLKLGGYLDTDSRIQVDPRDIEEPLPPSIHGALRDLVRTVAPWVRQFPTIAAWDDASGQFLTNANRLLPPAREFMRLAGRECAIVPRDAKDLEAISEATHDEGNFGAKSSAHELAYAKNLALESFKALAADELGDQPNEDLIERLDAIVSNPDSRLEDLASAFPDELRIYIQQEINTRKLSSDSSAEPSDFMTSQIDTLEKQGSDNEILRATLDSIADAVIAFNSDSSIRFYNKNFSKFWLIDEAELASASNVDNISLLSESTLGAGQFWSDLKITISDPKGEVAPEIRTVG